jgi:N-methylhydantoinase A
VNDVLAELFADLTKRANGAGVEREVALDLRYVGQEHSLTVPVAAPGGSIRLDPDELHDTFTREYRRIFDNALEGEVEIVSVRATLRTALPRRDERPVDADDAARVDEVDAYSFAHGERRPFRVVTRGDLDPGETLAGPAIVLEATATTYVDDGFTAARGEGGLLFLTDEGGVDGD